MSSELVQEAQLNKLMSKIRTLKKVFMFFHKFFYIFREWKPLMFSRTANAKLLSNTLLDGWLQVASIIILFNILVGTTTDI